MLSVALNITRRSAPVFPRVQRSQHGSILNRKAESQVRFWTLAENGNRKNLGNVCQRWCSTTTQDEPSIPVKRESVNRKIELGHENRGNRGETVSGRRETGPRSRKTEEEEDDEGVVFGLEQYAAKVHLGKPSGSKFDFTLEPMRRHIWELSQKFDETSAQAYLASIANHEVFEKVETRGRLLWNLLRLYGIHGSESDWKRRMWCGQQIVTAWSHGVRAGYLWGVMMDALNKSDRWALCETLWSQLGTEIEARPSEFAYDLPFVKTVRLAGAIDAFHYDLVDECLGDLAACSSSDLAAWAFIRCLSKSAMIHQLAILKLPQWHGQELKSINLRSMHFAPLLADAGDIERARICWLKEHTTLYPENHPLPETIVDATLEMEHLRAGLLVFARHPRLETPFDTILALIVERFCKVLQLHPSLAIHNHGLLYSLTKSDYNWLSVHLAHTFLALGSPSTIIASAMIPMCVRTGDSNGFYYWMSKRKEEDASNFTLSDKYLRWALKASHQTVSDVIDYGQRLLRTMNIPMQHLATADHHITKRYQNGLKLKELVSLNPEVEESQNSEVQFDENSETTKNDVERGENGKSNNTKTLDVDIGLEPNLHEQQLPPDSQASLIAPHVTRSNPTPYLPPITEEEYQQWRVWLASVKAMKKVGLQDLHCTQKLLLSYTIPGMLKEAEDLILGPIRSNTSKQDVTIPFLMMIYVEQRRFSELVNFAKRVAEHHDELPLDRLIGPAKLIALFQRLDEIGAPPLYILRFWDVIATPNLVSALFTILVKATIEYGELQRGEDLATQLFQASLHRVNPNVLTPAANLQHWLSIHRSRSTAKGLKSWIHNYRQTKL